MDLEQWIYREGQVVSSEFLRVDGFLNHRIAPAFIEQAAERIAAYFEDQRVSLVLTAEAGGNVVAYETARLLNARALYAKKGKASTMVHPISRAIASPTKGDEVAISLSREYLSPEDHVLIVDDFLYQGVTSAALADMALEAGATIAGFAFVIEKTFADGREVLSRFGVPIVSLIPIERMDPATGHIVLTEDCPLVAYGGKETAA
jgi:xanthine phosphoribosyltransferase